MNPLTNIKNLNKLNQRELALGLTAKKSWHDQYKDSAWIFVGGLPYDLTEGDVLCVFSQYGEIVNINLVKDKKTGKSKGFCFLCFEDQRSTILTVDNLNGIKLLGRTLRVDHVEEYRKPKETGDEDDNTVKLRTEGCAPRLPSSPEPEEEPLQIIVKKEKKTKKDKKSKKKKKKKVKQSSSESGSSSEDEHSKQIVKVKKEKRDPGYDRALQGNLGRGPDSYMHSHSDSYRRSDGNERSDFRKDRFKNGADGSYNREDDYRKREKKDYVESGKERQGYEEDTRREYDVGRNGKTGYRYGKRDSSRDLYRDQESHRDRDMDNRKERYRGNCGDGKDRSDRVRNGQGSRERARGHGRSRSHDRDIYERRSRSRSRERLRH
ncbi:RBMX2-like protein [Mya arenaria]|uniref:RBMX2-like protein n=1 Tax=Mya arenaria TaxID=6604 RepID=A0ABY7G109_MYAAR|nr:RNA-binding motif protein, X-linked 2-like [Mya arenaria]WAR28138.1 RBMX2-like protein [Mya arenaria]